MQQLDKIKDLRVFEILLQGKSGRDVKLTIYFYVVSWLGTGRTVSLLPLYVFVAYRGGGLQFDFTCTTVSKKNFRHDFVNRKIIFLDLFSSGM